MDESSINEDSSPLNCKFAIINQLSKLVVLRNYFETHVDRQMQI